MADEDRRKHLELIQGVVTRLAGNSFAIKGWAVALIAVLGGLATKDGNPRFAVMLLFPALCLGGLDAYYLRQERLFRKLYTKVAAGDASIPAFSMNTQPFEPEVDSVAKVAFSRTILWLYLPIMAFIVVLIAYSICHSAARVTER